MDTHLSGVLLSHVLLALPAPISALPNMSEIVSGSKTSGEAKRSTQAVGWLGVHSLSDMCVCSI